MKSLTVFLTISLLVLAISWFLVSPNSDNFSVPSQRVITGKSAAMTEKWDGKGKFINMIWY
ncbi:MAG: hypothetical protein H8E38_01275 [SAR324 cluster bacterium]|nr:hypothetical protein [SAR324 cluster bacterium]MBL7034585.1 hypothetical protein [SAR324 cluster bacterium]